MNRSRNGTADEGEQEAQRELEQEAQRELQIGIALTRRGEFSQAIPHLKLADGVVLETFAVEFNLGLCYVATRQFPLALRVLSNLRGGGQQAASVKNLLAQAYIGDHQAAKGLIALRDGAEIAPFDEKLYIFVSDACLAEGFFQEGIEVTDLGLRKLPNSARLLLQRGLLRSKIDENALAKQDWELAAAIAPLSDVGYIASVQAALSSGKIDAAIQKAREGIRSGHAHYMLLTMLGEAILRSGVTEDLGEAQTVLEKAAAAKPNYASAQISLGKVYLISNDPGSAVSHLEIARHLDPGNPAVYSNLAAAYRRAGNSEKSREMLSVLTDLNAQEAKKIGSSSGGHSGMLAGQSY